MWDFSIQTDHVIEAWRLDLVVVDTRTCKIIDFAVPGDRRIEEKEQEKIEKYQDLRELQKIWNVRVKIIPLVVGSLGAIRKQFGKRLKEIRLKVNFSKLVEMEGVLNIFAREEGVRRKWGGGGEVV